MNTDSDIIYRSRGAPEHFGELFERHARTIHRYASLRVGTHIADDIMSETFLVAFAKRDSFDLDVTDARPWLFGIATNLLKAHRRIEARLWKSQLTAGLESLASSDSQPAAQQRSDELIDAQSAASSLARALAGLKPGDRDVLLLHAWGDLNYEGIAQAIGIPIGTVRSRLNRARRILQKSEHNPHLEGVAHGQLDPATHPARHPHLSN